MRFLKLRDYQRCAITSARDEADVMRPSGIMTDLFQSVSTDFTAGAFRECTDIFKCLERL
jgi:hypothetical protein